MTIEDPRLTGTPAADSARQQLLDVHGLGVTYGTGTDAVEAIGELTFAVATGEFVCVVGPSGCGKTTLLKALAGLLPPTRGEALMLGRPITGPRPELALVFQDYTRSLMPWLTVRKNVTFPLAAKRVAKGEQLERADQALSEVGLTGFADRYPWQLSGGMQQRVAIARAVAYEPSVLLMDEPFAAVDAQVRADLEDLVLRVQADTGVTVVLVTHDIDESVYLANRVIALSNRPTTVRRTFEISLPYPRDQLTTRASSTFIELRTDILKVIQAERVADTLDDPDRGERR